MLAKFTEEEDPEEGRWHWENNDIRKDENKDIPVIRVALRISCEKGTYIRTICADIGKKLGCGGCMERLLRTKSGEFSIEDSHSLAELEKIFELYNKNISDSKTTENNTSDNNLSVYNSNILKGVLVSADKCFMEYPALNCK